jgi:hypothetical protein
LKLLFPGLVLNRFGLGLICKRVEFLFQKGNLLSGECLLLGGLPLEMLEVECLVLQLLLCLGEVLLEEFTLGVEGVELLFCVLESFAELDVLQFGILEMGL